MRRCRHCGASLDGKRRDALTCSKRCRQAWHRFQAAIQAEVNAATPKRLAYADPPYPGRAHYYKGHPDYGGEVDHRELLGQLALYDGWALSTAADALPELLAYARDLGLPSVAEDPASGYAIGAWCRGARPGRTRRPRSAWEPVLYRPARVEVDARGVDSLCAVARPRRTDPGAVIGMKPAPFIAWLFELLAARPGDDFADFFPGSGGVGRAWALFCERGQPAPLSEARHLNVVSQTGAPG